MYWQNVLNRHDEIFYSAQREAQKRVRIAAIKEYAKMGMDIRTLREKETLVCAELFPNTIVEGKTVVPARVKKPTKADLRLQEKAEKKNSAIRQNSQALGNIAALLSSMTGT